MNLLIINFVIGFISDIVLNVLSRYKVTQILSSLLPYFKENGILKSAILAGITTYISAYITLVVFGQSIIGAFVVGYILDIVIDKYNIFGDSLKPYYKTAGSGLWGGMAIMFAMIISLFLNNYIKYI
jgi:hypothetical protein